MTNPTPPLLTEAEEREVNEVLFGKSGLGDSGWEISGVRGTVISRWLPGGFASHEFRRAFTESTDTLRLVEEQLTPEQWDDYLLRVCAATLKVSKTGIDAVLEGAKCFAKAPVALRARAAAEVVKE